VDWKPERAVQAKVRDSKIKIKSNSCWNALMEEYTAPVQNWRLLPRFLSQELSFSPWKHQLLLCTELTISNGLTKPSRMSSRIKTAECRTTKPLPSPSFLFCLLPSSHLSHTVYMIVQITFIHSCIHASILSWIHTFMRTQRTCIYNIESHMFASIAHSRLQQTNGSNSFKSVILVCLVERCR